MNTEYGVGQMVNYHTWGMDNGEWGQVTRLAKVVKVGRQRICIKYLNPATGEEQRYVEPRNLRPVTE